MKVNDVVVFNVRHASNNVELVRARVIAVDDDVRTNAWVVSVDNPDRDFLMPRAQMFPDKITKLTPADLEAALEQTGYMDCEIAGAEFVALNDDVAVYSVVFMDVDDDVADDLDRDDDRLVGNLYVMHRDGTYFAEF